MHYTTTPDNACYVNQPMKLASVQPRRRLPFSRIEASAEWTSPSSMTEIAVTREGSGPELLLVHGGASARATWPALEPLSARWTLVTVHRRGYLPSPAGRHDFELDARDLEPLLESRPH